MSTENSYTNVSEVLTAKLEEIEQMFQVNVELSAQLQKNTMSLITKVSDVKILMHQLSSELKSAQESIGNNDAVALKKDINRLTEILSFTYKQPKPERTSKAISATEDSSVTAITTSLETDDGQAISDMTIDFDALVDEASTSELKENLRRSFGVADEEQPVYTPEETEVTAEAEVAEEETESPAEVAEEETEQADVTAPEEVVQPVTPAPEEVVQSVTPAPTEVAQPAEQSGTVVSTSAPKRESVLAMLSRAKIH